MGTKQKNHFSFLFTLCAYSSSFSSSFVPLSLYYVLDFKNREI